MTEELTDREIMITLEQAKNDDEAMAALVAMPMVYIYSREHMAYWREGAHGYTLRAYDAWVLTGKAAYDRTCHCDPSKGIEFERCMVKATKQGQGNSDDGPGVNDDKTWQDLHYHDDGTPKRKRGKHEHRL